MMAIFGWSSADLAAYYCKKASQKKLAADSMHLLAPTKEIRAVSHTFIRSRAVGHMCISFYLI